MHKLRLDLDNKVKIVVLIALAGLIGGLGYVYSVHSAREAAADSRVSDKTTASPAPGVSDTTGQAAGRADMLTPPPAPATSNTAWPDSPAAPASLAVNGLAAVASADSLLAGDTLTVTLYENSGAEAVNSVQTRLTYDASKLEYVAAVASTDFGLEAATDAKTAGVIQLARAVSGSSVSGVKAVATLHFTVKADAHGLASVSPDMAQSYIVRASDATNILQSVEGARLTVK